MIFSNKFSRQILIKNLKKFIRFHTVTLKSNAAFAYEVGQILKCGGFKVFYQKTKRNSELFVNVIGIQGKVGVRPATKASAGRALLLCSHLDTVPPGDLKKWTKTGGNPWRATQRGDVLYGLGAADDKGSLAAMLQACLNFPLERLKRPLMIMGTFGEESGMGGARTFTRSWKGPKPCMAIVGEPTDLGITYRHKGIGVLVIELESRATLTPGVRVGVSVIKRIFKGRSGHSSRPWLGDNALDKAIRFLKSDFAKHKSAYLINLAGGHAANIIPDKATVVLSRRQGLFPVGAVLDCHQTARALVKRMANRRDGSFQPSTITSNFGIAAVSNNVLSLTFDFRLLPGQDIKKIHALLEKELAKKLKKYPGLRLRIWVERDNPPLDSHRKDPLPQFGRRLLKQCGLPPDLSVKPACTEAGIYAEWGVPAIIFGPGKSVGNIHAPNERISMKQLEKAVSFYSTVIAEVCAEKKACF